MKQGEDPHLPASSARRPAQTLRYDFRGGVGSTSRSRRYARTGQDILQETTPVGDASWKAPVGTYCPPVLDLPTGLVSFLLDGVITLYMVKVKQFFKQFHIYIA